MKVASEYVVGNREKSPRYALDSGFSPGGGYLRGRVISVHRSSR